MHLPFFVFPLNPQYLIAFRFFKGLLWMRGSFFFDFNFFYFRELLFGLKSWWCYLVMTIWWVTPWPTGLFKSHLGVVLSSSIGKILLVVFEFWITWTGDYPSGSECVGIGVWCKFHFAYPYFLKIMVFDGFRHIFENFFFMFDFFVCLSPLYSLLVFLPQFYCVCLPTFSFLKNIGINTFNPAFILVTLFGLLFRLLNSMHILFFLWPFFSQLSLFLFNKITIIEQTHIRFFVKIIRSLQVFLIMELKATYNLSHEQNIRRHK